MTKLEDRFEFAGKNIFCGILIIVCTYLGATLAHADTQSVTDMKTHVRNLVIEPDYTDSGETHASETSDEQKPQAEKLQFEPLTDDMPILEEQILPREIRTGVEYPDGFETVIAPTQNFVIKDEKIEEKQENTSDSKVNLNVAPQVNPTQ